MMSLETRGLRKKFDKVGSYLELLAKAAYAIRCVSRPMDPIGFMTPFISRNHAKVWAVHSRLALSHDTVNNLAQA